MGFCMRKPPSYRKKNGRDTAIVSLTDRETGERREYQLGPHGSSSSREAYHRIVAEWESNGRRLPKVAADSSDTAGSVTIEELCLEYWLDCKPRLSQQEQSKLRSIIRLICQYHGSSPASSFGPRAMASLITHMINGDLDADPPRKPWNRTHLNQQLGRLKRMFKWGASRELFDPSVYHGLTTVDNVRKGTAGVIEGKKVSPIDLDIVEKTKPFLSKQIQALIDLQIYTGARAGELLIMRPMDLDRSNDIWLYTPEKHKRAHTGQDRSIFIGPRAKESLSPYLERHKTEYMFSPAEAEIERRGKEAARENSPGDHYTTASYGRAIMRACKRAGLPHWTPHQLRHTAATRIRAEFGLEAAQIMLGHSSALVTEAVYAERDQSKGMEIAGQVG